MVHPPHSPALMPCNFHLFGCLTKHLAGKQFAEDSNIKQALITWPQTLDTKFLQAGIQDLMPQLGQMLKCQE